MGISENILTIADNTDDVIEVVSSAQKQVQGPYIKVDDVANVEHNVPCRLGNKNLVNLYGYSAAGISNPSATRYLVNNTYGTTLSTIDPENSVTVTQSKIGNETDAPHYSNGYFCVGFYNDIPENTVVTFSFEVDITNNPLNTTSIGIMCNGAFAFNKATQINNRWVSTGTYKNNGDKRYIEIRISGISGTFSNFQLELGSTATPYTPYITDFSQVEVSRYGKNLYDISKGLYKDILVDNGDGSYTITKTNNGVESGLVSCFIPANTDITLSVDVIEYTGTWWTPFPVYFLYDDGTSFAAWVVSVGDWDNSKIRTYKPAKNIIGFQLMHPSTNDLGTYTKFKDFQIELGTTGTTYEPFKEPTTYQSTAEGIVNGVTSIAPNMTLLTNVDSVSLLTKYFPEGTETTCESYKVLKTALQDAEKLF